MKVDFKEFTESEKSFLRPPGRPRGFLQKTQKQAPISPGARPGFGVRGRLKWRTMPLWRKSWALSGAPMAMKSLLNVKLHLKWRLNHGYDLRNSQFHHPPGR